MSTEEQKQKILRFFATQEGDYWKTINEVSRGTGIDAGDVSSLFSNSGDFVRSSYRQRAGEPLYTSRDNFRNKAPFVDKLIGAFKNRID